MQAQPRSQAFLLSAPLWRGLVCVGLASAVPAHADEPVTVQLPGLALTASRVPFRQFWTEEATGSSMLTGNSRQALPVVVYDRRDMERSGATSLSDFVQSLPMQINGFNLGNLSPGLAASGPLAASLRGLTASTLVLLNGRRLPKYSRATVATERTSVDLNIVPLSAVDRVEVLSDGASARYGSDAVAGVINIITLSDYKHARVGVDGVHPLDSGGQTHAAFVAWGGGDLGAQDWDAQGHISLTQGHALQSQERASTASGLVLAPGAVAGQYFDNPLVHNRYGWPAVTVDASGQQVSPLPVNGQCATGWVAVTVQGRGVCRYNPATGADVYPDLSTVSLYTLWRHRLTPSMTAFGELAAGQRQTVGRSLPATAGPWSWQHTLADGNTALVAPTPIGAGHFQFKGQYYRATLGVQGYTAPWHVQTNATIGRRTDRGAQQGINNLPKTATAISDLGWSDAEVLNPATPEVLARLQAAIPAGFHTIDRGRSSRDEWQAQGSRTLTSMDDGDVNVAVGASWSRESIWTQNYLPNTTDPTQTDGPAIAGQRHISAVHTELEYPLRPTTVLALQLRHDHYSDVGDVNTGKLALRYRPNRQWMWRASLGTGFRAPTLEQLNGTTPTLFATNADGTQLFYGQANPGLRPERSHNLSLGLRLEPSPNWTAGFDYWHLSVRNGIQLLSRAEILGDPYYKSLYWQQGSDGNQTFTLQPLNLAKRTQSGIDYDMQYRHPTDWGRVRAKLGGTLFLEAKRHSLPGMPDVSEIGEVYNGFSYIPRHRLQAQLALERPSWQTWLQLQFISGNHETYTLWDANTDTTVSGLRRYVPGYATLDWGWRYLPDPHNSWTVNLINVTDQAPPYRFNSRGGFVQGIQTGYGDYRGRSLRVQYEHRFH